MILAISRSRVCSSASVVLRLVTAPLSEPYPATVLILQRERVSVSYTDKPFWTQIRPNRGVDADFRLVLCDADFATSFAPF